MDNFLLQKICVRKHLENESKIPCGNKSISMDFSTEQKQGPHRPLSVRLDSTGIFVIFSQLILSPQQDRLLGAVPQPSVPTHHLKHMTWGGRNDGDPLAEQPGYQVPPGPPRTVCQLSAMPVPSGTDTPYSFILPAFPLHVRCFS